MQISYGKRGEAAAAVSTCTTATVKLNAPVQSDTLIINIFKTFFGKFSIKLQSIDLFITFTTVNSRFKMSDVCVCRLSKWWLVAVPPDWCPPAGRKFRQILSSQTFKHSFHCMTRCLLLSPATRTRTAKCTSVRLEPAVHISQAQSF